MLERVAAEQSRQAAMRNPNDAVEPVAELHEEVARLPERYRAPIVLCYLEGMSHEAAARILRCRLRTLETRLQRGKAKLRVRLEQRGLAPENALLTAGLAAQVSTRPTRPTECCAQGCRIRPRTPRSSSRPPEQPVSRCPRLGWLRAS